MQFMRQSGATRQPITIRRQSALIGIWRERTIQLRPVDIFRQFVSPQLLPVAFPYLSDDERSFLRHGYTLDELDPDMDGGVG